MPFISDKQTLEAMPSPPTPGFISEEIKLAPPLIVVPEKADVGFLQGIIQDMASPFLRAGVTVARFLEGSYQINRAILAKVRGDDEEFYRRFKLADEVIERGAVSYGYFGEATPVDPKQSTWELTKDAVGTGMEIAAWIVPAAPKTLWIGNRLLLWGGRGFSFGAGRELGEGKSVTEALKTGIITGTVNIVMNGVTIKIVSSATRKLKLRKTIVAAWESFMKERSAGTLSSTATLRTRAYETIKKEVGNILSARGLNVASWMGVIYAPTRKYAMPLLAIQYLYRFLASPAGERAVFSITSSGLSALSRMEPAVRSRIGEAFMAQIYSQFVDYILGETPIEEIPEKTYVE